MGTGLAETIGVVKSNKFRITYVLSVMEVLMNIQDLQTLSEEKEIL